MESYQCEGKEPLAKKSKIQPTDCENNNENSFIATRPTCKYGERCFRSSSQHKKEFHHPKGNAEKSDSSCQQSHERNDGNLPLCPKGEDCEDTELIHFAEFTHPTSSQINGEQGEDEQGEEECKELEECDVVEASEGFNSCGDTQEVMDDYALDGDSNEDSFSSSISRDDTVLSRGPSIVKCYSILSEEERKELIRRAFELKDMLKNQLCETVKIIANKNRALMKVHKQLEKTSRLEGELEALARNDLVYFPLFAEREFREGTAAQIHFRLAESQFYRLVDTTDKYRISKVEYIVNPALMKRFAQARDTLRQRRGESDSHPVLAFHGTQQQNVRPICETGFRVPGDSNFEHVTDTGWYGRGVYFSEYPSYSMTYIKGASMLLLCQVLPGKPYRCVNLIHGEPLQTGHDSHTSPDGKELVIFNSHHILPSYVVHYGEAKGDYSYKNT